MNGIAEFRRKLQAGQLCIGLGITFTDPLVSDALGDAVDFLWIDLEHSNMSPEAVNGHLLATRARQIPGIVRVAAGTTARIKPLLDAGAQGIIAPQVRTVAEVQEVISACRYPPQGQRGFGPRVPTNYGRLGGTDYLERANRELLVAVMIENVEALAVLDEILALPGLDSVVIGPSDLSLSQGLGGDLEHPMLMAAMQRIATAARAAGKFVGAGMGTDATFAARLARIGVQWLQVGSDFAHLLAHVDQVSTTIRRDLQIADRGG